MSWKNVAERFLVQRHLNCELSDFWLCGKAEVMNKLLSRTGYNYLQEWRELEGTTSSLLNVFQCLTIWTRIWSLLWFITELTAFKTDSRGGSWRRQEGCFLWREPHEQPASKSCSVTSGSWLCKYFTVQSRARTNDTPHTTAKRTSDPFCLLTSS